MLSSSISDYSDFSITTLQPARTVTLTQGGHVTTLDYKFEEFFKWNTLYNLAVNPILQPSEWRFLCK